jgi:hypothetical protein
MFYLNTEFPVLIENHWWRFNPTYFLHEETFQRVAEYGTAAAFFGNYVTMKL